MKRVADRCNIILVLLYLLVSAITFGQQAPPSGPQEEMIPEEAQQQNWTRTFQEAETAFNSDTPGNSIPIFQKLIAEITEQKVKRGLTEPEQMMLWRSLDYLGQAFYGEGQQDQSQIVFLKLIELNPNYQMNEDLVSPKIINFVSKIKNENLGLLTIQSEPTGATVKLDGNTIGTTDIEQYYGLKGDHNLEISKPGFLSQSATITIVPKKTQKLKYQLERSSSVAYFITYPKNVEIIMDGKSLGVTGGNSAERAANAATMLNLPASDFSAEFTIPDLQPGVYEIELRRPCWKTEYRKITIEQNDDYLFEPVALVPSNAYLNVEADDPQANIFIDNEYIGIVPKQKLQLCSGTHVIKLKGPHGKFEKEVTLKKDEVLSIQAVLNPSLNFLGLVAETDILKTDLEKLSAETAKQLSTLKKLNFIDNSTTGDRAGMDQTLRQIVDGINTNTPDKERKARIQEICARVESDLLIIGYVPRERLQRTVRFYLLSNWSSMADIRTLQVFDNGQWDQFKAELDFEEPLFEKRLGANLIDTSITPGPVIARVSLKTSDESQPLSSGDIVTAVNGKTVQKASDVYQALSQLQSEPQITIAVQKAGVDSNIPIKMMDSPMEIRFDNPDLLFNRQMVAFQKAINISVNKLEKSIAMLNIGLCHMHFGEYEQAYEQLRQIQLEREVGIGQGTVLYRIAQCYRELGYKKEAEESLNEAAQFSKNTLLADDGPSLIREIKRAQLALE